MDNSIIMSIDVSLILQRLSLESQRNKDIFMEYMTTDITTHQLANDYNISQTRVTQIVNRCKKKFITLYKGK